MPRWLSASFRRKDPAPPWQWPFVLAFTGVRGIVSLAAALAIPFATAEGHPFPGRDLILFLTFSVILVTLVVQGLMLPFVIRALGLAHAGRRERHAERVEEQQARQQAIEAGIARLDQLASERDLPGGARATAARASAGSAQAYRAQAATATPRTRSSPICTAISSCC